METRVYGRSGLRLSILGFGCGAVGGLMVRGSAADQDRAVGLALDAGINYFDTAVQYGNGASETNLGRIMGGGRKQAGVAVGTKVRIPSETFAAIGKTVTESMDGSLQDSRTNSWAGWAEGGFSVENALSAQCGIGIALLSDAAARQASPRFNVCNHRESGT